MSASNTRKGDKKENWEKPGANDKQKWTKTSGQRTQKWQRHERCSGLRGGSGLPDPASVKETLLKCRLDICKHYFCPFNQYF